MRFWNYSYTYMYISRERSGQEEEKTYFILHFKKVVIINVA